jgi:hypothetical protein
MHADSHREFLKEVEADIELYTEKLRELQAVRSYHASKLSGKPDRSVNGSNGVAVSGTGPSTQQFKNSNQREAAAMILANSRQPMRAREIARVMLEGGYPKQEISKLSNALFTTMTRDPKRFRKVSAGLWGLVEQEDRNEDGQS